MQPEHPDSATDPRLLASHAYRGDRYLRSRQRLYDFQQPTYDLPGITSTLLAERNPSRVLDIGCGNGTFTRRLRRDYPEAVVVGLDIAADMLTLIDPPTVKADAMRLPFADASMDAVLAMHMIYHLPDIERGLAEMHRVLSPDGILIASTNGADDKMELDDLWSRAAADVLGTPEGPRRIKLSRRFDLENAPTLLSSYFTDVDIVDLPGTIQVTDPDPVLDHLRSYESFAQKAGVPFAATIDRAQHLLIEHLEQHARFTIHCSGGILAAFPC